MRGWFLCVAWLAACGGAVRGVAFPEQHAKLSNGMTVIVLPDPTSQLVEVDVRYQVGSREDPPGKAGLAHLVEHLMFQQRQAGPDKPPIGALLRQLSIYYNAFTDWDSTHYETLAAAGRAEDLVALEVARLETGCETIDPDAFAREREVVRNEIRTRFGTPEAQVQYLLLDTLYPARHPYRQMVGGDDEQIAAITLDDACRFMRDYYVPERATFVIAGGVTEARGRALITRTLGPVPARPGKARAEIPAVRLEPGTVEREMDVEETSVFAAWALPPQFTPEWDAASAYIGELAGRSAWFGSVYEFATDVGAEIIGGAHAPMLVVQVSVAEPGQVGDAIDALRRAASGLRKLYGLTSDDRARMSAAVLYPLESLPARAQTFADYAQFRGHRYTLPDEIERVNNIDAGFVSRVGREVLDPDKARILVVRPKQGVPPRLRRAALKYATGDDRVEEFAADRSEAARPVDVPAHATPLSRAKTFTLDNGMRVVLVPAAGRVPLVTIALSFRVGSAGDPADRRGVAAAAALHYRGPSKALAGVGAEVAERVDAESTTFFVRGMSQYLDVLVRGLRDYMGQGSYSQDGLEAWARQIGHMLARPRVRAERAFERAWRAALFGEGHPYAQDGHPTQESLGELGHDALLSWKSHMYVARNATAVIVGEFDLAAAEAWVRSQLGDLGAGAPAAPPPPVPPTTARALGLVADHLDMMPVTVGFPVPRPIDGDYATRLVVAQMLDQRVRAVREKLGASYGVHASLLAYDGAGAYVVRGSVDPERAGEALKVLREAVASLRRGDGFVEDFVRARRRVIEQRIAGTASSLELVVRVAWLDRHGEPLEFDDDVVRAVAALTPAHALRLAAAELPADHEVVVTLGKRHVLDKAFAEAGLAGAAIIADR